MFSLKVKPFGCLVFQDFLLFEEGFFLEWGHCLLMGTNCFTDPRGNVLNIEFEENLMAVRKFHASDDIVTFYDIYMILHSSVLFTVVIDTLGLEYLT